MRIEIYSSADVLRGDCKVVSVDFDNQTITVDALPAGVVATDVIFEYGSKGKEMAGLHKIITNTGSLFGISAAQYSLWKGNSHPVGGTLTFNSLAKGLAKPVAKGLQSDVTVYVNPAAWADLMTEQAGTRRFDVSYKSGSAQNGFESLEFYSQNGKMSIVSSIFVKEGFAYIFPPAELERIGSSDITFERPGFPGKFFREMETSNGYELRAYSDQALFTSAPGKMAVLKYIKTA
jgi:hypothetical protein